MPASSWPGELGTEGAQATRDPRSVKEPPFPTREDSARPRKPGRTRFSSFPEGDGSPLTHMLKKM